jgi:hypothetical protein
MTKDGRPSLLNDIRHFYGVDRRKSSYLKGYEGAVAFGRRLAWLLNGERVSLGAYTALYLLFTPSLEPGAICVTDEGGEWWQRYTHVGVPREFLEVPEASHLVVLGTIGALKAIRPDLVAPIEAAATVVESERENLRFLLKSRDTKRFIVEISCNVSEWPQPSYLFVSLTDASSGEYLEAAPIPLMMYLDALDLAGTIRVNTQSVRIVPNQSIGAQLTAIRHEQNLQMAISDFSPRERPVFSKLLKPRG